MSTLQQIGEFPATGVASDAIAALVPSLPKAAPTKIGLVGVALKMHFQWDSAVKRYKQAVASAKRTFASGPFELVAADEPFESPEALVDALDKMHAQGIRGLVLLHASYTAGEMASYLGRWLLDHPMPLMSWATPEPTGGRLTANSLCCQNFILNGLSRLAVKYAWMFKDVDDFDVMEQLGRFARTVRARARMIHGKTMVVGVGRVPGFYDAECDELAVMKRFGLRFDRVELAEVIERGKKFEAAKVKRVMEALTESPQCSMNNVDEAQFLGTLRLALATLEMAAEQNYIAAAIRCWPTLLDQHGYAADGAIALLNDQGLPTADESDMPGMVTMAAMHLLSEGAAIPTLMDISLLDAGANRMGFWHCGGSATRLLREGTKFQTRRHSIMENADESTAVGMLIESLLATGPVTVARYRSPDLAKVFSFEGEVVDSPMAFRGAYAEVEPREYRADQIMGSILDQGMDHHWIVGRGHLQEGLTMLNHWLGVERCAVNNSGGCFGLSVSE